MKSRSTELSVLVVGSLVILGFWGTNAQGQGSLFSTVVSQYIEEKALAMSSVQDSSSQEVADISSVFAGMGGEASMSLPEPTLQATTVQNTAMVAMGPVDSQYIDQLSTHRSDITSYTVEDGDQLSFIASDYGVTTDSIMWANKLKSLNSISVGQVLRIPPVSGIIHTAKAGDTAASVAKKYGVTEDSVVAYNYLPKDGSIAAGDDIIVPDGKMPGQPIVSSTAAKTTGTLTVASILARGIAITPALIKQVGVYTEGGSELTAHLFSYLPDLGDYFMNPTTGFNWGILHDRNGVDEANACGTPIKAAADGVVTFAATSGWNGGFGKYIKISHANGTETLYGHASKVLVTVGQKVTKGQQIALMGTTGNSTGCHLHFEVHGARNPLAQY